jgi:dolichol-phosphate mannosyltransferase
MERGLDIVVPVYNERENFETLYKNICELVHTPWRLLMVYDFAGDTTLQTARPIAEKDPRVVLVLNEGKKVLGAMKTGLSRADAPAALVLMVDDPIEIINQIDAMYARMNETGAAVVAASRYMPGGSHGNSNTFKAILSRTAGLSLYLLIGLPTHDATYATKLFRTSFLRKTPIESTMGFTYAIELTLKAYLSGEKIAEVPVKWSERTVGMSRFTLLAWIRAYLYWYLWGFTQYYVLFGFLKVRK